MSKEQAVSIRVIATFAVMIVVLIIILNYSQYAPEGVQTPATVTMDLPSGPFTFEAAGHYGYRRNGELDWTRVDLYWWPQRQRTK